MRSVFRVIIGGFAAVVSVFSAETATILTLEEPLVRFGSVEDRLVVRGTVIDLRDWFLFLALNNGPERRAPLPGTQTLEQSRLAEPESESCRSLTKEFPIRPSEFGMPRLASEDLQSRAEVEQR